MRLKAEDIAKLEQRIRAHLINSLSGFKSANLLGTINQQGQTNLCIVSSVFHLGAHPPLMGLIFRPNTVPRHSLENILSTGEFTLNHVHTEIYQQAHQTSARYPREQSEFKACGLTEQYGSLKAPFVRESHVKIGLKLEQHIPLTLNQTEMVIGRIVEVDYPDSAVKTDGHLDLESCETVAISGLDSYHQTQKLARLSYAKPYREVSKL